MKQDLRRFITDNFLFGAEDLHLSDDDSFLEKGLIDSTGVLELIAFLEEKYAVKIQDHELLPENLDSISKLTLFLERKQAAAA